MLNGLDLFSGIGGITLALEPWVKPIAYCENDKFAQAVLLSRMQEGKIPLAPIWDDVRTLSVKNFHKRTFIDCISAGFPCQDISVAGLGKGLDGERSGLFFEIIRLTKEINPAFVFLENVPAIRTRGLREVARAFTEVGYDCRWTCLSAASVGANHKRERWFILAHANGLRQSSKQNPRKESSDWISDCGEVGDASSERFQNRSKVSMGKSKSIKEFERSDWWKIEPSVGRVVDGIPSRVDRIKCLGNSVVPLQAQKAFMKLITLHRIMKDDV